MYILHSVWHPI